MNRIIALVDMDCFYVQVEQRIDPTIQGLPCAVVQYNEWEGGAIIAVNYEARKYGVKRPMRGNEAKSLCPEIKLVKVPEVHDKADLTRYREAGAEVIEVLKQFSNTVERASVDEAYVDLTVEVDDHLAKDSDELVTPDDLKNSFVIGWESDDISDENKEDQRQESIKSWLTEVDDNIEEYADHRRLAIGAKIVERMRIAVLEQTQFRCSAGIAHNKVIAKLCCGLNKPNKQTIVPHSAIPHLYKSIPVKKVRGFGGKFGSDVMEKLSVSMMSDLEPFSENFFISKFGQKSGKWLFDISQGLEYEEVCSRSLPKSIGCGKNFMGKNMLRTKEQVKYWLRMLSLELEERLLKDKQNNKRVAKHLTVGMMTLDESQRRVAVTRSLPIVSYSASKFHVDAFESLNKVNAAPKSAEDWMPPAINLHMSAAKFEEDSGNNFNTIKNFFLPSTSHSCAAEQKSELDMASKSVDERDCEMHDTTTLNNETNKSQEMLNFLANELNVDSTTQECKSVAISAKHRPASKNVSKKDSKKSKVKSKQWANKTADKTQNSLENMIKRTNSKEICSNATGPLNFNSIDNEVLEILPAGIKEEVLQHLEHSKNQDQMNVTIKRKKCDKCGEEVKDSQFDEHLDYHLAKELSHKLNSISSAITSADSVGVKLGKRTLPAKGYPSKKAKVNCKKINSYFKEKENG